MCSPEDHAVLEAAYQRNSKPDKAERTAIVNSVSLGEKEVQVCLVALFGDPGWAADRARPDMVPKQKTKRSPKVKTFTAS